MARRSVDIDPARRRLSLDGAADRLLAFWPAAGRTLVDVVVRIPEATRPAWDCVVFELRGDRIDVMASFCPPRPTMAATDSDGSRPRDPLSFTSTRSWQAGLGDENVAPELPLLWYEWDCPGGVPQRPLESICVSSSILGGAVASAARWPRALGVLCSPDDARCWSPAIERLVVSCGARGELLHVAPLEARGLRRLRLTFHVAAEAIVGWFDVARWPGAARDLGSTVFTLAAPGERLGVQLELLEDGSLGDYLGLETKEFRGEHGARHWMPPLLDGIRSFAPLADELVEILPRWPGDADGVLRHAYTKVVHDRGDWIAKAYLGVTVQEVAMRMRSIEAERRAPIAG